MFFFQVGWKTPQIFSVKQCLPVFASSTSCQAVFLVAYKQLSNIETRSWQAHTLNFRRNSFFQAWKLKHKDFKTVRSDVSKWGDGFLLPNWNNSMVSLFDFWQVVAWYESQQAQANLWACSCFFRILRSSQIIHLNHLRFQVLKWWFL